MTEDKFVFKEFTVSQSRSTMRVNTDGILLGAWVDMTGDSAILDIGCGNGLISLMIAQRNETATVDGVEIDEGSYQDAVLNVSGSPWHQRMSVVLDSVQNYAQVSSKVYDHLVSNPPFFTGGTFSSNEGKNLVRHTVKLSHGDLLTSVNKLISSGGRFSAILPYVEGLRFIELANRAQLYTEKICEVFTKPGSSVERLLLTFCKKEISEDSVIKQALHLRDHNGQYSNEFITLTYAFYLNLAKES